MSTDCVITVDHLNDIYNSGDMLNGHVKLQTQKSKSIRGISITIVGYAKISWRKGGNCYYTTYSALNKYLNSVTYVIGSAEGDSFDFAPGFYTYTFSCALPKELPSSLEEICGKIKYQVIVTINRHLKFDNVFKKVFIVNHISDLNLDSSIMLPRSSNIAKKNSSLFGRYSGFNGKIRSELQIPCGGYVPGEEILFQLNIYNDTNIDLTGGRIKLRKCTTFISSKPAEKQKEVQLNIIVGNLETIPSQSHKEIKGSFQVPYLIPTQSTKNVKVDYTVKAKISLGCFNREKHCIEIPIIIGTIPFNTSGIDPVNTFNTSSMNGNNSSSVKHINNMVK